MTATDFLQVPAELEREVAAVLARVSDRGGALATAESCTGGLLASLLTDIEGFGHVFDRGFVAYTDAAKEELLGLDPEIIAINGAVSREVALAMATGAIEHSGATLALAVTGFAGPGGPGDEEGLVHFATADRHGATLHRACHFGPLGRGPIRLRCLATGIALLREALA